MFLFCLFVCVSIEITEKAYYVLKHDFIKAYMLIEKWNPISMILLKFNSVFINRFTNRNYLGA